MTFDPSRAPPSEPSFADWAADLTRAYLASEETDPVRRPRDPDDLMADLGIPFSEDGLPEADVVEKLRRLLLASPTTSSRGFFNQLFAGREPMATLGEMLAAVMNLSMYTWKVAGPMVLVERECIRAMAAKVGWDPAESEGAFTPGGSLSNLAAMVVARNEALENAREDGLSVAAAGAPLTVYTSEDDHYSIRKAAGLVGLGRGNLRKVPTDDDGRMDPDALRGMILEDRVRGCIPIMVNATAGTTVQGAFDPLDAIADVCQDLGVWLHVDGAFGGTALLSRRRRHLLAGCRRADSFTWDAHKMMGVPLTCSVVLFPRRGLLTRHFDESADYLFQQDEAELNPGTRSIQCGRRNDALKLWTLWQHLGDRGWEERVEKQFALAEHAVREIERREDLVLVRRPQSINVCFEVRGKSSEAICDLLDREGRIKVGWATVGGRKIIRVVFANPRLATADVDRFFDEVLAAAARLPARAAEPVDAAAPAACPR